MEAPTHPPGSGWRSALGLIASVAAPPRCAICGAGCSWRDSLCAGCQRRLSVTAPRVEPGPPGIEVAWSAGDYEGIVREAATALKFGGRVRLARSIAAAIAARAPAGLLDASIVPVPAAPLRLIRRGFDPAEEIAVELSELTGAALVRCLDRDHGRRQVGRPRRERIADPPRVRLVSEAPDRAVLVDDVHTTGATLAVCARALRAGGAERVVAVTFARA